MSATYRIAGPSDAEAVDRIFRTSFCDTFAHLYRSNDLETFLGQFSNSSWQSELGDARFAFRLGEVEGEAVGYVKIGPLTLPVEPNGCGMELKQLYILKEFHGVGIAHALMDWAVCEAQNRGGDELFLTVYVDNHRARRFYERCGFEAVGRFDFMVGTQADEDIIMRKRL